MSMTPTRKASVAAVVVSDGSGRLDATLAAIDQQVYGLANVVVVRAASAGDARTERAAPMRFDTLGDAVEALDTSAEYLWVLAEGAVPRPDALQSVLLDAERTDAGIVGSKIVGENGELHSVGLVTDAFGVPYSGLDRSELDQGQYDVVRDVAAVSGVALLVRRDLLHGLGGVDVTMAPQAAAIDLAQRARLKGARVAVSPASEVVFDAAAAGGERWREEAGRIRGMIKAYGLMTLAWALPLDLFFGLVEVIVSIFLGKWYGFDLIKAWAWNVGHIADTVQARHRARAGQAVGDAELFRYQRRGSVKISRLVGASMRSLRARLPGDDRFSVESLGHEVRQPAFVVGVLAVLFVLAAARNLWSSGFPANGYTLPFPTNGGDVLSAYAGGWNPAGLGSPEPLRPLLVLAGFAKSITFNAANFPEYAMGAGAMLAGIWGMMRLLRTWAVPAAPGLIAGVVYVAGPAAQGVAGNTHLGTLLAIGVLPWALRLALKPVADGMHAFMSRLAAVILTFGLLGALSPLLLFVVAPIVGVYALFRFSDPDAWRAFILALAGTAGGALLLSPWIWSARLLGMAKDGYAFWHVSPVVIVAGSVVVVAAVITARRSLGLVAGWGALVAGAGLLGSRSGDFGLGTEAESISLAVTALGVSLAIGIVADALSGVDSGGWRRFVAGIGSVGVVVLVVASLTIVLGGRIGLPGDRFEKAFDFTRATEGWAETSRILVVGPPDLLPGDSRTVSGGSYRVVSGSLVDLGEARLAPRLDLDAELVARLERIISGDTKRAGGELATFGIRWIVVMGDSTGSDASEASVAWREVFAGQLDLLPLTAAVGNAVFASDVQPVSRALTTTGKEWHRTGWTYMGDPEPGKRVFVAENPDDGWGPGTRLTTDSMNDVSAETGMATYAPDQGRRTQAVFALVAVISLFGVALSGRSRP